MKSANYSESFRNQAVEKLLAPNSGSIKDVAEKIGVPGSTLFGWKQKYANSHGMKKSKSSKNQWTAEQKLKAVAETLNLSESERGEYLRKNGLLSSDLESWREESLLGLKTVGRPKKDPEVFELRKDKKELERDLRRKEKALAEMSARVVLLKKSREIFGVGEDDE